MEQERIEALSRSELRNFLGFLGVNKETVSLVIPDYLAGGGYSQRIVDLRTVATVYYDFPEKARKGIPIFALSNKDSDTQFDFNARLRMLRPGFEERVKIKAFLAFEKGEGAVLAPLLNDLEDLAESRSGFLWDQHGRYESAIRSVLDALTKSFAVFASSA